MGWLPTEEPDVAGAAGAPLDATSASALLRAVADGSVEALGTLTGSPLLLVDLDRGRHDRLTPLPTWLPRVVVGIARHPDPDIRLDGVDLAMTAGASSTAPPGWVGAGDLDQAVDRLARRISTFPQAAVMLCQVLRMGEPGDVVGGLMVESIAYSTLQAGSEFRSWLAGRALAGRAADSPSEPPARIEPEHLVLVERRDDQLLVTLNRPHVRNAFSARLRDELCAALAIGCTDRTIRSVHLQGAGPDFCSGGDLDEFGTLSDPATGHLVRTTRSAGRLISLLGIRCTARLHGSCVGAGIELPAFSRRVRVGPETQMRLPEVGMGLIPGAGGTVSIPARIGRHRGAWMGLSGEAIDAVTALAWGLADEPVLDERPS